MGNGIFLGEALLPLNELKLGGIDERLENLEQRQLPLTRPTCYGELKFIDTVCPRRINTLIVL